VADDANGVNKNESSRVVARWRRKFACAFRGFRIGTRGQSSFHVHFPAIMAVVALAWWLRLSREEWLILLLCIVGIVTAEMFNSAIEHLARAITREQNPEIRDALDVASAAVLIASVGAAIVGLSIFGRELLDLFKWFRGMG